MGRDARVSTQAGRRPTRSVAPSAAATRQTLPWATADLIICTLAAISGFSFMLSWPGIDMMKPRRQSHKLQFSDTVTEDKTAAVADRPDGSSASFDTFSRPCPI